MQLRQLAIRLALGIPLLLLVQAEAAGQRRGIDAAGLPEFRTWTDRSGAYQTKATLVEIKAQAVLLQKEDGATASVPRDRLSAADQRYVSSLASDSGIAATGAGDSADTAGRTARTDARDQAYGRVRARTAYRTSARVASRTSATSPEKRGTRQVIVEGVGTTPEEALKDCFRNAVAEVVGSIVNTETRVEEDRLILDRILTFTDGFVETFDEIGEPHIEDGLVHRRIMATVRRDSLLVACGRAESASIDARGLYPEAMSKLERLKSARALLQKTLDGLPGSVLQVRLAGRPPLVQIEETNTTLAPELTIRVDHQKYDALMDRMNRILNCLAEQSGSVPSRSRTLQDQLQARAKDILKRSFFDQPDRGPNALSAIETNFSSVKVLQLSEFDTRSGDDSSAGGDASRTLILVKGASGWSWFKLDERVRLPSSTTTIAIAFRDAAGNEVNSATVSLGPWIPVVSVAPGSEDRGLARTVFISPSFLCYNGEGYNIPSIGFANSLTINGQVTLGNDQLPQLDRIDVRVLPSSPFQE